MSIGLATSETRFVDFGPPIDSDAKGHASDVLPVAELDLTGALKGNGFFSDLSEPSIRAILVRPRSVERHLGCNFLVMCSQSPILRIGRHLE